MNIESQGSLYNKEKRGINDEPYLHSKNQIFFTAKLYVKTYKVLYL